jgi:nicotinamidase-related amidase
MPNPLRNWDPFALILIDVQRDFWTDEISRAFPDYDANVRKLLDYSREKHLDVIHLRAKFKADKTDWMSRYQFLDRIPCIEGTSGAEVLPCAENKPGEKIFYKQTFDGFDNPELHDFLSRNQKRFVLVAGLETSVCVLLTAASAAQKGYLVAVVADCCGDSIESHRHTLARYPFIFSTTTVDEIPNHHETWEAELAQLEAKQV